MDMVTGGKGGKEMEDGLLELICGDWAMQKELETRPSNDEERRVWAYPRFRNEQSALVGNKKGNIYGPNLARITAFISG